MAPRAATATGESASDRYTRRNMNQVSLVIPGRDCASTLRPCLQAVVALRERSPLHEIIFVDDGSTDETPAIAAEFPVTYVRGAGRGAGAARNLGWRAATAPLIWFVDSDCVAEPDALIHLLPHLDDACVAGVGGSYGNMRGDSLLACLIHEEIVERHRSMPARVNFLATFNVIYRRSVLEEMGGFDETYRLGQDAEMAWRVLEAGHELAFDIRSRVKHFHPTAWRSYLRTQARHGYWRVALHLRHRGHSMGDSYSDWLDHVQPALAVLSLAALMPAAFLPIGWLPVVCVGLLALAPMPMTWRLLRRTGRARYLTYGVMSFVRSFWRGAGMVAGVVRGTRPRGGT